MKNNFQKNYDREPLFIQEIIKGIKEKKTAIFCGAGISFHSGLPLANYFIKYLLGTLNITEEDSETIINSNIPFEAFIEALNSNSNIDKIFEIFKCGVPNANHFFLAKLAKAGYLNIICTTNFDQLIEKAFEDQELKIGDAFQVYYREDDLDKINWNNDIIKLIKIHGSIDDMQNMAITLKQVSSEYLSEKRKRVIEYIFSQGVHENVLVLGYSCSDIFDISIHIQAIREHYRKVILIDHCDDKQIVRDISEKENNNPFKHFLDSKWILYNTDKLITKLWKYYCVEHYPFLPIIKTDSITWKKYVDFWSSETPLTNKYIFIGQIFSDIAKYELSKKYNLKVLHIAKSTFDREAESCSLNNLGVCYICLDDYQKARNYIELSLNMAREEGDKKKEAKSLGNLSNVYYSIGDYRKSKKYIEQTLRLSIEIGDSELKVEALHNLGNVYIALGEFQKAVEIFEQGREFARTNGLKRMELKSTMSISRTYSWLGDNQRAVEYTNLGLCTAKELGDKHSEAIGLNMLGLTYFILGDYQKSIEHSEQTLCIAREIGNRIIERDANENLGHIYFNYGDNRKAENYYELALQISKEIGDKQGEGHALGNLGRVYYGYDNYRIAINYYERALQISKEISDKQGEENWIGNLGTAYFYIGDYRKSRKYLEKALKIARVIKDKDNENLWLGNLGDIYYRIYDYQKAKKYYEEAFKKAREISNKFREGCWIGNIGNTYYGLNDYQKAKEYYEWALRILRPILGYEHPKIKFFEAKYKSIKV